MEAACTATATEAKRAINLKAISGSGFFVGCRAVNDLLLWDVGYLYQVEQTVVHCLE